MVDRAKKISELQATTSVANTDKLVVLKDAVSTTASTRSMTINAFAQSLTPLVQANIPNTTVLADSINVASNGTSLVPVFSYSIGPGKTGCCHFTFHARDYDTAAISGGDLMLVALGSSANINYNLVASIGDNQIFFDNPPTVNTFSNTVTLYMRRDAAATSNVNVRYSAIVY